MLEVQVTVHDFLIMPKMRRQRAMLSTGEASGVRYTFEYWGQVTPILDQLHVSPITHMG
jgi:hypothetical protein